MLSFVTKHIVVTLLVITDNAVRHRHTGTHTHTQKNMDAAELTLQLRF